MCRKTCASNPPFFSEFPFLSGTSHLIPPLFRHRRSLIYKSRKKAWSCCLVGDDGVRVVGILFGLTMSGGYGRVLKGSILLGGLSEK